MKLLQLKYKLYLSIFKYLEKNYYPPIEEGYYINSSDWIIQSRVMNPKLYWIRSKVDKLNEQIIENHYNNFEELWCVRFPFKRWYVKNK